MRIVAGLALVATLVAGTTAAQADDTLDYVALGDSAAAGPLIPNQDPALWCLRSDQNYPQVAAKLLGARLTDVTCSGSSRSSSIAIAWLNAFVSSNVHGVFSGT